MNLIGEVLMIVGLSTIVNVVLEAYHNRRASEEVGEFDKVGRH